eukprot:scaffold97854_cov23-Tisochrysis_lutea.AAC.1
MRPPVRPSPRHPSPDRRLRGGRSRSSPLSPLAAVAGRPSVTASPSVLLPRVPPPEGRRKAFLGPCLVA